MRDLHACRLVDWLVQHISALFNFFFLLNEVYFCLGLFGFFDNDRSNYVIVSIF